MLTKIFLTIGVTIGVALAAYYTVRSMYYAIDLGPFYVIITVIVAIGVSFIFFDTYKRIWGR